MKMKLLLLVWILLASCGSKDNPSLPAPVLSSVQPDQAAPGDRVCLAGQHFGEDASSVSVVFGAAKAEIVSVSATQIEATVPSGSGEVQVLVSIGGRKSNALPFRYGPSVETPSIRGLSAGTGIFGDRIEILGSGFLAEASANRVLFDEVEAQVVSATAGSLKVIVPYIYRSVVQITVNNGSRTSEPEEFTIDLEGCDLAAVREAEWKTEAIRPGVTWKSAAFRVFDSKQSVHVLEVDLSRADLSVGFAYQQPLAVTSAICRQAGALGGINASFFNTYGSTDYLRLAGKEIFRGCDNIDDIINAAMVITGKNEVSFKRILHNGEARALAGDHILVAGPILCLNGVTDDIKAIAHNTARHPRTAVGITGTGMLLMVAVDGRSTTAGGMKTAEVALLMKALQATDAMSLDGGGSTTLFIDGRGNDGVVNIPSNTGQTERKVSNVIYVKAME